MAVNSDNKGHSIRSGPIVNDHVVNDHVVNNHARLTD